MKPGRKRGWKILMSFSLVAIILFYTTSYASWYKISDFQYRDSQSAHQIMLIDQDKYQLETLDFGKKTLSNLKKGDYVSVKNQINIVTEIQKANGYYILKIIQPRNHKAFPYG